MKEVLKFYADEMAIFNGYTREFSLRYPETASAVGIGSESGADPQVKAMIQSAALLTARVKRLIDKNVPQFTEPMLEALYPHYLRPVPSHTIVQFDLGDTKDRATRRTLPRGTALTAPALAGVACEFTSAYAVELAPLAIASAEFLSFITAPAGTRWSAGVSAEIRIVIESTDAQRSLAQMDLSTVRVFIDAEPSLRAALIDALFLNVRDAFVQDAAATQWQALSAVPIRHVGFADDDAMLPFCTRSRQAFRLLTEYFAYPDTFHFIDIDLAALVAALPAASRRCTLHLGVAGVNKESDSARLLGELTDKHLQLGCTPVVNLFKRPGVPIHLDQTTPDYPVLADASHAAAYEVHTIDAVRLVRDGDGAVASTEFSPLYARSHDGRDDDKGKHYLVRRSETLNAVSPGHETRISLIDPDWTTVTVGTDTLSTDLRCTNRDLPASLAYGHRGADFHCEGYPREARVRVLRRPSASYRFASARDAHWRLIGHLTLDYSALTQAGLPDFHKMLSMYQPPGSMTAQRFIHGIVGLEHGLVRRWLRTIPRATLMPGVRIRMTIDLDAFAGRSVYLFAQVMDHYFSINQQQNCYTELELIALQTGEQVILCQAHTAEPLRP